MATTGTFDFNLTLAQLRDEAVERGGLDPQKLVSAHLQSIRVSTALIFSRWASLGNRQWKFETFTHTVSPGEVEFDLPTGTVGIQTVTILRNEVETEMYSISRSDYRILHDKNLRGRPDRYFFDRRRDDEIGNVPRVFYWHAGENDTDQILLDLWRQIEDVGGSADNLDIPFRFLDCFAAELAARVALKWNKKDYKMLRDEANQVWKEAKDEDRDTAPLVVTANYEHRYGRRR